ncbi:MAG: NUDIX hydrolase [Bacteroidia bacterium]|nr:NUDIX hydrolase [Bacteroidia bacterium]
MNYCSNCGSEQLVKKIPEGDNRPRICCENCDSIHYRNPKMVVGCLPVWEGKILLCKRAIEPRKGYWGLPAGYLENKESVEEGALRETLEESGAEVDIVRMHAIYNIPRISQVYIFFLADMRGPELDPGEESLEAKLFELDEIPYEEMAFPSSSYAIRKYIEDLKEGFKAVHLGAWTH